MSSADRPETRLATRLSFLVAGFGVACWAPLVPFAKQRLMVDDGVLGLLLLCLGAGSIAAMPLTGILSVRHGCRPIIVAGGLGLAAILPFLAFAASPLALGLALFVFGLSLGAIDVAMNVHAVEVERAAPRPLMSGFHALFSFGGIAGSLVMTSLLSLGLGASACAMLCAIPMATAIVLAGPRLLPALRAPEGPLFIAPRGIVLLLAALAAISFLVEGAILDWSAVFATGQGLVPAAKGGMGYALFSIAMTTGRFAGDRMVVRVGDRGTLFWGSLLAIGGFVVLLVSPVASAAMSGFLLIGFGASNIVPVLIRRAGAQTAMPVGLAVASISAIGYAGMLTGPAGIGLVARTWGLAAAFWGLAALLCLIVLAARFVTAERRPSTAGSPCS